jgi:hypothetical protein
MSNQRYFISIENLPKARGESHELSFHGGSPESFASLLQDSLRTPSLWQRWKSMQPDPDEVDPALGVSDPTATVKATQSDLHTDVEVVTSLPHAILKHRLTLLIGKNWTLRDVRAA